MGGNRGILLPALSSRTCLRQAPARCSLGKKRLVPGRAGTQLMHLQAGRVCQAPGRHTVRELPASGPNRSFSLLSVPFQAPVCHLGCSLTRGRPPPQALPSDQACRAPGLSWALPDRNELHQGRLHPSGRVNRMWPTGAGLPESTWVHSPSRAFRASERVLQKAWIKSGMGDTKPRPFPGKMRVSQMQA